MRAQELGGLVCIVTGASKGLGRRIAQSFWIAGANLILVARSEEDLLKCIDQLPARVEQKVVPVAIDLSERGACARVIHKARDQFGKLDVLVNNAAVQGPIGPFIENDLSAWEYTVSLNLLSVVSMCQHAVPLMLEKGGGKIVNISGGGATGPRPMFSAYAASKAAVIRFSETLAEEMKDKGIYVNCVAPGLLNTSLQEAIIESGQEKAGQREFDQALNGKRVGEANMERASSLCTFLASPVSDQISGKLISAVWDPWETLPSHLSDLQQTDVYTLRRIVPIDRALKWGDR